MEYPVYLNHKLIGHAQVEKRGLYVNVNCRCVFPSQKIYKIKCISAGVETDIGVCIPCDAVFVVRRAIPCKLIDLSNISFVAYPLCDSTENMEVSCYEKTKVLPLDAEKEFEKIALLPMARYDPQRGIVLYG